MDELFAVQTPLEKLIGIPYAEDTYNSLSLREQVILDLLICGWTQADVAALFQVKPPSIAASVRRMRFKLADSKLQLILEARIMIKTGAV